MSLLELNGRLPLSWYLVFHDPDKRRWWDRWLKPGFRHCYALRCDRGVWVAVDGSLPCLSVDILPFSPDNRPYAPRGGTIIHVNALVQPETFRTPQLIAPFTCVEVCKAVLGIRAPFVWTPWQLYRHVRRGYVQT